MQRCKSNTSVHLRLDVGKEINPGLPNENPEIEQNFPTNKTVISTQFITLITLYLSFTCIEVAGSRHLPGVCAMWDGHPSKELSRLEYTA